MKKFYLIFLPFTFLFGCTKTDTTPSWLIIDSFNLVTDELTEGSNSQGITDAWIFMDGAAIGVFSLPARVPILAVGEHKFTIYAGVKVNGISATRARYPFYERYDVAVNLVRDQEVSITPVITYKPNIQFQLIEDFEDIGVDFEKDATSDTDMLVLSNVLYPDIVKYGSNCGAIYVNATDSLYKGATNTNLNLPTGEDVYVEIDFMNTNSMAIGVIAENSGGVSEHTPLLFLNPQEESSMKWKKIYVNLKDDISFEIHASNFEIYLLSIIDPEQTSGTIYLDNIKVLRYE